MKTCSRSLLAVALFLPLIMSCDKPAEPKLTPPTPAETAAKEAAVKTGEAITEASKEAATKVGEAASSAVDKTKEAAAPAK